MVCVATIQNGRVVLQIKNRASPNATLHGHDDVARNATFWVAKNRLELGEVLAGVRNVQARSHVRYRARLRPASPTTNIMQNESVT